MQLRRDPSMPRISLVRMGGVPVMYWMLKLATLCPPSQTGSFQPSTIDVLAAEIVYGLLGAGGLAVECEREPFVTGNHK